MKKGLSGGNTVNVVSFQGLRNNCAVLTNIQITSGDNKKADFNMSSFFQKVNKQFKTRWENFHSRLKALISAQFS